MNLQEVPDSGNSVEPTNENFEALDWASVYAKDATTTSALTWGYLGGRWGGFSVSAGTFTLTDDSANYIVAKRSDGVTTCAAASTNWDNATDYARVYKVTTADGAVTAIEDHRAGPNGIHAGIPSSGAETWTGDKTLAENVGIVLDAALSADGKYSGIVEAGTAGAALAFGEICYLAVADTRWEKAKADVAATSAGKLGLCVLAAASDGDPTTMLLFGKARADTLFPALTVGAPVYLSAATAGVVTSTAPTGTTDFVVRVLGFANTADELHFNPSNDYITLA